MGSFRRDGGGIVLGWLTKVAVVLFVVGLVGFDAISVGAGMMNVSDEANTAAGDAASQWRDNHDLQQAYAAAVADLATGDTINPSSFRIDPDGTVHLVVSRQVRTALLAHIGPLRHYADVQEAGIGRPPS